MSFTTYNRLLEQRCWPESGFEDHCCTAAAGAEVVVERRDKQIGTLDSFEWVSTPFFHQHLQKKHGFYKALTRAVQPDFVPMSVF